MGQGFYTLSMSRWLQPLQILLCINIPGCKAGSSPVAPLSLPWGRGRAAGAALPAAVPWDTTATHIIGVLSSGCLAFSGVVKLMSVPLFFLIYFKIFILVMITELLFK